MTRFVLALIRLIALAFSFMLSTLAAAAFVTFALFLGAETEWLRNDPGVAFGSVGFTFAAWLEISHILFAPFLVYVVIAEPARLTGLITNTLIGGGFAVVYMVMTPYVFDLPYSQQEVWTAALAAGFIGGFIHWMLAGNRAGHWMGPAKISAQSEDAL